MVQTERSNDEELAAALAMYDEYQDSSYDLLSDQLGEVINENAPTGLIPARSASEVPGARPQNPPMIRPLRG